MCNGSIAASENAYHNNFHTRRGRLACFQLKLHKRKLLSSDRTEQPRTRAKQPDCCCAWDDDASDEADHREDAIKQRLIKINIGEHP